MYSPEVCPKTLQNVRMKFLLLSPSTALPVAGGSRVNLEAKECQLHPYMLVSSSRPVDARLSVFEDRF